MALPELTQPDGTPDFLAEGHAIELVPVYADIPAQTGHDRRQRVYTTAPRMLDVGLQMTAAQMLAWANWCEGPLRAGAEWFSAPVANQGPGLLWWKARFIGSYTADSGDGGASFRVSARLLLVGDGTATPPYVPQMRASVQIALTGAVVLTVPASLQASVSIALRSAVFLRASVVIALSSIKDGAEPSAVDFEKRWIWMRYPYAAGHTADVTDASEFDQRSWMGI